MNEVSKKIKSLLAENYKTLLTDIEKYQNHEVVVMYTFNPSMQEAEIGRSLS